MAIGPPVELGGANAAAGSMSLTLTITADSAAGNTIIACLGDTSGELVITVTDSAGNVYTQGTNQFGSGFRLVMWWCIGAAHLPVGGTITATWNGTTAAKFMDARSVAGIVTMLEEDGTLGTGAAPSVFTDSSLTQFNTYVQGMSFELMGAADAFTEDSVWTSETAQLRGAAMRTAYLVPTTRAPVWYVPTWGTSNNFAIKIIVFGGAMPAPYFYPPAVPALPTSVPQVKWGYTFDNTQTTVWPVTCAALPVSLFRLSLSNTRPSDLTAAVAQAALARANGQDIWPGFQNTGSYGPGVTSAPPADIPTYKAQIAGCIAALNPTVITIENEADDNHYQHQGSGTPDQIATATATAYLAQLAAAVQVAHPLGVKVAESGLSSGSLALAHWQHLWLTGPSTIADEFAALALGAELEYENLAIDLPNTLRPSYPILGNNPDAYLKMQIATAILQGIAATGADYCNLHSYWSFDNTAAQYASHTWARSVAGIPAVSNECGVYDTAPATVTALATFPERMGWSMFVFFGAPRDQRAVPIADLNTGVLNAQGLAYQAVIAKYGGAKLGPQVIRIEGGTSATDGDTPLAVDPLHGLAVDGNQTALAAATVTWTGQSASRVG